MSEKEDAVRLLAAEGVFGSAPHTIGVAATSGTVYLGKDIPNVGMGPLQSLVANLMNHGEIGLSAYCYGSGHEDATLSEIDCALLYALGERPSRIALGDGTNLEPQRVISVPLPKGRERLLKHYIGKGAEVFDVVCSQLMDHAFVSSQLAFNGGGGCALKLTSGEIIRASGIVLRGSDSPVISSAQAAIVALHANGLVKSGNVVVEAAVCIGEDEQAGQASVDLIRSWWPHTVLHIEKAVNCAPLNPQPRA
ncbi:hypothetical protein Pmar_PMAR009839 [Perkinsus marinus ATCC 50983]|uniref:Uncharacterized protein n=1 Tax=Perkinsus marinus (strain ATCC 50983 / TXsc) TaxID=423536 RepID=C5KV80_PERM5|nr:hypothetical protein Pmar_PMAR009839 [Perkinsus marinus ATCC 50983]EER11626.1 hypothetical protein Pmar_PMAR009839 [Perkinsus marinus ATCC 50983]|eukprot:XP_002779831.1 hypothetical protein Pmar_PMAR009839 [Perkinsus marinus ATCC 50983]